MSNNLFSEFNKISAKQWKQKIQVDLKGADYNESLIWQSPEDIHVKPFYSAEDLENLINNTSVKTRSFKICQAIFVADIEKSNLKAVDAIKEAQKASNLLFQIKMFQLLIY